MFVIDRTRGGTEEAPEETIDIAGTTGNIYNVHIGKLPTCTCPDNQKGNQCKHIVYVHLTNRTSPFCRRLNGSRFSTKCSKPPNICSTSWHSSPLYATPSSPM